MSKSEPKCKNCKYFGDEWSMCNQISPPSLAVYERKIRRAKEACGRDAQYFKRNHTN